MSLDNLVKTNQLKAYTTTTAKVHRWLVAAKRNPVDADVVAISDETCFNAAYKTIMRCWTIALRANGYRPSTITLDHHLTMILNLPLTLRIPRDRCLLLDALQARHQRLFRRTAERLARPAARALPRPEGVA